MRRGQSDARLPDDFAYYAVLTFSVDFGGKIIVVEEKDGLAVSAGYASDYCVFKSSQGHNDVIIFYWAIFFNQYRILIIEGWTHVITVHIKVEIVSQIIAKYFSDGLINRPIIHNIIVIHGLDSFNCIKYRNFSSGN